MKRLRNEEGTALIWATIILFIALGLGLALMITAQSQESSASNSQNGESAFSMAEAALNAQIYALSVKWPTAHNAPGSGNNLGYPYSCSAASAGASYCPSASDLSAYPSNTQTCPASTPGDAWSPGQVRSSWTTYVRDGGTAGSAQQQFFTDAAEETDPYYNSSFQSPGNNYLWVRAVGTVNCKTAVVTSEVSMQTLGLKVPQLVLDANSFSISNSGSKAIIDTQGVSSTISPISVRCGGTAYTPPPPTSCAGYNKPDQISPSDPTQASTWANPPAPSPVLNASQLAAVKTLAQTNGTYFPSSYNCNNINAAQLSGSPVYIEGGPSCSITINGGTMNSLASPGFVVLVDGTIYLGSNSTYYGVIYGVNASNSSANIVELHSNSTVVGGIEVDGNAALDLGSSGNGQSCGDHKCGDLEFDAAAFNSVVGFGGADQTPNSFRQLPANQ